MISEDHTYRYTGEHWEGNVLLKNARRKGFRGTIQTAFGGAFRGLSSSHGGSHAPTTSDNQIGMFRSQIWYISRLRYGVARGRGSLE
jgi:hypothetical protein